MNNPLKRFWFSFIEHKALAAFSRLSALQQGACFITLSLSLVVLFSWSAVGWLESYTLDIKDRQQSLQQYHQQKADALSKIKESNRLKVDQVNSAERLIEGFKIPYERFGALERLTKTATANHLAIIDVSFGKPSQESFYQETTIKFKIEGHYHAISTFFVHLVSLPEVITVGDFKLKPVEQTGRVLRLEAELILHSAFDIKAAI